MSARRERLTDWLTGLATWITAILVIAGVTHLTSILAMPRLAPHDAYARMAALAPLHRTTVLPPLESVSATTPFDDPALARSVCRYDLTRGPVRLRANLVPETLMLISFHTRYGEVFIR